MSSTGGDFGGRRAPYAPISAIERFFERIRDRQTPERVDHRFLRKLSVAQNNEYSLLSALKFLGVLDDLGVPTVSYRSLQSTDQFKETLWRLVRMAYKPVFDTGAERWPADELVNFFRISSSPSQAKNAARFFRAVCQLAGHAPWNEADGAAVAPVLVAPTLDASPPETTSHPREIRSQSADVLRAKAELLQKLPAPREGWTAEEYLRICDRFLEMLGHLDSETTRI